jgi:NAD(P)-dependent dehydrogenase (short-subunit alcohol dehydrogenase family)
MDVSKGSAIITGGGSGLGEACARRLAGLGAKCVIVDLNEEKGKAVAEELAGAFVKADVSNAEQVQEAVETAAGFAPLRVLVNGAGIGSAGRTVNRQGEPFNLDTFEFVIRVNLIGSFNCLRLAAAMMSKTEPVDEQGQRGAIVLTRMPTADRSRAIGSVIPTIPPFDAE